MDMSATYTAFAVGGAAIVIVYVVLGHTTRLIDQMVAGRRVPAVILGPWLATGFTFSTTSLFSGATYYLFGWQGFLYYFAGNTLGLILMVLQAPRIKHPSALFTYPPVVAERFGRRTGAIFTFAMPAIQALYILPLQFTVVAGALKHMYGVDPHTTTICAALIMALPVIFGGMRASVGMDLLKGVTMVSVVVFAALAIAYAPAGVWARGIAHAHEEIGFNWQLLASTAGFPFFLSLACAGPLDQSLFQRYFSVEPGAERRKRYSIVAGVAFFALHMVAGGVLGYLAASPLLGVSVGHSSIAGYAVLEHLLPSLGIVFAIGVAWAFLATGDSALNASSSVCALDMYKGWVRTDASESEIIFVQRLCMLVFVVAAVFITEQGYSYFAMVTGVGVFRSVLIVPALVGMYASKARVPDVFWGIVIGMGVSTSLFLTGHEFLGSLSGIALTSAYCLVQAFVTRHRSA